MNIDPLAEDYYEYSTYNYTLNNPIIYVDPDGRGVLDWIKNLETGEVKWHDASGDDAIKIAADKGVLQPLSKEDKAKYKNLGESFFGTKGENAIDDMQIEKQQDEYLTEVSSDLNEKANVDYTSDELGNGMNGDVTKNILKATFMSGNSTGNSKESTGIIPFVKSQVKGEIQGEIQGKILSRTLSVSEKTVGVATALLSTETMGNGSRTPVTRASAIKAFKTKVAPLLNIQTLHKIQTHKY